MLKLFLLGRPIITFNDAPVADFVSDKALVLLCYLAINPGDHAREKLATLLWGEMAADRARANLRMALYNVQKQLPDSLNANRKTAAFTEGTPYWLDVHDFVRGCQDESDIVQLETAVALYRDEFLADITIEDAPELDDWLRMARERYRLQALSALHRVAGYYTEQGDWKRALNATRKLLDLEPWQETSHRKVMRLLARVGDYNAALAQYATCRQMLADELGVDPMPETSALYERISAARARSRPRVPAQPTPLQGRERELGQLHQLLVKPSHRLITIGGPGGIGKTRLALACAAAHSHDFLDGVIFVPLAGLSSGRNLAPAILTALKIPLSGRVEPQQQLLGFLHDKEMLLVLDNLEHILDESARLITTILDKAPDVKLLVTSREYLNLRWEFRLPLAGLDYPSPAETAVFAAYSALNFFEETAVRVRPEFDLKADREAVVQICQFLEGLPLGIELAAALVNQVPCAQLAAQITQNMDVLASSMRDVPLRHRSLGAVFAHSWALLSPEEQDIFRQLAVFRGGFSAAAAKAVAAANTKELNALARKSLLRPTSNGRYEMHEIIHAYAAEKLAQLPAVRETAAARHCQYFMRTLNRHERTLTSYDAPKAVAAIQAELDNVRLAWQTAVSRRDFEALATGLTGLSRFCSAVGLFHEAIRALEAAAECVVKTRPQRLKVQNELRHLYARLLISQANFQSKIAAFDAAIQLARASIDEAQAIQDAHTAGEGYLCWGRTLMVRGQYQTAVEPLQQAYTLGQQSETVSLQADSLLNLGNSLASLGQLDEARQHVEAARALYREYDLPQGENAALQGLSIILRYQGELETAVSHLKTALVMDRKLQDRISEAGTLLNLGVFMANLGDNATARKYHQQSLPIFRQIGDRQGEAFALINMADVDLNTGDYLAAINLTRQTLQISQEIGDQNLEAFNLMGLGVMYAHLGMWSKSESFLADALACCQAMDDLRGQSHVLGNWSLLETWRGHNEAALQRGREATEMARRARDHQVLAYALTSLAHALASRQTWAEAEAAYNEAIALRESSGEHHLAIENVAGLAFVALAQGDMAQATRLADKIWRYLQNASLDGTDDRFGVYWACYRVWVAAKDERAPIILAQAVAELQALADKIEDDNVRQSFLNNIPSRRHIMAAWVSKAAHT